MMTLIQIKYPARPHAVRGLILNSEFRLAAIPWSISLPFVAVNRSCCNGKEMLELAAPGGYGSFQLSNWVSRYVWLLLPKDRVDSNEISIFHHK